MLKKLSVPIFMLSLVTIGCGGTTATTADAAGHAGSGGSTGTAGTGGHAGTGDTTGAAGTGGTTGTAGTGGQAGSGGTAGTAGTGGHAGTGGTTGTAGTGGQAGSGGAGGTFMAIAPCSSAASYMTGKTAIATTAALVYSPACLKVTAGTKVTIAANLTHPLAGLSTGSPNNPIPAGDSITPQMVTFTTAGFYPFQCSVHFGIGMAGVVWVQ